MVTVDNFMIKLVSDNWCGVPCGKSRIILNSGDCPVLLASMSEILNYGVIIFKSKSKRIVACRVHCKEYIWPELEKPQCFSAAPISLDWALFLIEEMNKISESMKYVWSGDALIEVNNRALVENL